MFIYIYFLNLNIQYIPIELHRWTDIDFVHIIQSSKVNRARGAGRRCWVAGAVSQISSYKCTMTSGKISCNIRFHQLNFCPVHAGMGRGAGSSSRTWKFRFNWLKNAVTRLHRDNRDSVTLLWHSWLILVTWHALVTRGEETFYGLVKLCLVSSAGALAYK